MAIDTSDVDKLKQTWNQTTTVVESLNEQIPEIANGVSSKFPNVNITQSGQAKSFMPQMKKYQTPLFKILSTVVIQQVRQPSQTPQSKTPQNEDQTDQGEEKHLTPVQRITNEVIELTLEIMMRNFNRGGHH